MEALVELVGAGRLTPLTIEKANGHSVFDSPAAQALRHAGAGITPKGVRIAATTAAPRTSRSRGGRTLDQALAELDDVSGSAAPGSASPSFDDPRSGSFRRRGPYRR